MPLLLQLDSKSPPVAPKLDPFSSCSVLFSLAAFRWRLLLRASRLRDFSSFSISSSVFPSARYLRRRCSLRLAASSRFSSSTLSLASPRRVLLLERVFFFSELGGGDG